jgi:polysaccharide deacetylase 2 family uncharacterized protein YibQ
MGRGILAGLAWGSLVCVGIVTVANQVVDVVSIGPVSAPSVEQSDADETVSTDAAEVTSPSMNDVPNSEIMPESIPVPQMQNAPDADEPSQAERDDTSPMAQVDAPVTLAPPVAQDGVLPSIESDSPVLSSPQSQELTQPSPNTETVLVTPDSSLPSQAPSALGENSLETQDPDVAPAKKIQPQGQKTLGTKVGSFTDRTDTLKSDRLPSVAASNAPVIVAEDLPAILANAVPYTKIGPAPNMSVVLVDIGDIDPTATQLKSLPFPVTFAVDALAAGATARAQSYTDAGLEVMALIGLPEGATAQDAAVTLTQANDLIPTSIGYLDVPSASFQTSREIAAQVVASSTLTGHGVLSFSSGLNALMQEAQRAKQPAAIVFRDFDGKDQDIAAMKRFLDQAAFRAGIDEEIILVGRSKPDTLQALVEWSLGNRSATVEMVPLSFLLTSGG